MERTSLTIEGMTCGPCVGAVTRALQELDGVEVEQVKVGSATVAYDPRAVTLEQIARAVEEAEEGYGVRSMRREL